MLCTGSVHARSGLSPRSRRSSDARRGAVAAAMLQAPEAVRFASRSCRGSWGGEEALEPDSCLFINGLTNQPAGACMRDRSTHAQPLPSKENGSRKAP